MSYKTEAPEKLEREDQVKLLDWLESEVAAGNLPQAYLDRHQRRRILAACLDWHQARGVKRASWLATARSWFRKQAELENFRPKTAKKLPRPKQTQAQLEIGTLLEPSQPKNTTDLQTIKEILES